MNAPAPPAYKVGIVKQVLSGDTIIIRKQPVNGPPPEKVISLSGISAPKLARQRTPNSDIETKDEPFAWEAREFLRKLLVGKEVIFTAEKPPNSTNREYGNVWAGKDPKVDANVTEALLSEGLAKVRDGGRNIPALKRLVEIEETAKSQGKGVWSDDVSTHIRDIKWTVENPKQFVNKHNGAPVPAIIEYVRDGSTVRVCLLPDFTPVTMMLSGIRCPAVKQDGDSEPFAEEARFFLESKLLQKDVEVLLESVNNNNFVGTILHPFGNIAEHLLRNGFARCVDWSLAVMRPGQSTILRQAEKQAKDGRLRIWANYVNTAPVIAAKDKEFTATVLEVVNGDALVVKLNSTTQKKIFLASIRPPREKNNADENEKQSPRPKGFKPLYDIPWMYEAREFLRKKLIGKKVNVTVDYIQPANNNFPEKTCCTVQIGGVNLAEALVAKGLASVVRYRNDNDQRSSHYDKLLEAELKAQKSSVGVHAKKDIPAHRIQDTSGDSAKSKKFFPFLKRAQKTEAVVEFVASGSRMRIYIPKESVLVTFLLAGISCPRGQRPAVGGGVQSAEPFGEEALHFTKEKVLQHDVIVTIEEMDKAGNFIGWLWIDNENLSVALVEHGLASMHHTAESSEFARQIKTAEENALKKRIGVWKDYVEVEKEAEIERNAPKQDRVVKYESVVITEITNEGHFYAQNVEQGPRLESLMARIHQELTASPPLPGSYAPRRGALCAARFSADDKWYRSKIERVLDDKTVHILYVDYGNREAVHVTKLAALPGGTEAESPYASEYTLACVKLPSDDDDRAEALSTLYDYTANKTLLLNVEQRGPPPSATLIDPATTTDIGKSLIREGVALVENVREYRLATLCADYRAAQEHARKNRLALWRHGDITDDDATEFGARR